MFYSICLGKWRGGEVLRFVFCEVARLAMIENLFFFYEGLLVRSRSRIVCHRDAGRVASRAHTL